jgi:hypothetical protein
LGEGLAPTYREDTLMKWYVYVYYTPGHVLS